MNGRITDESKHHETVLPSTGKDLYVGSLDAPKKPSDIHRDHGTIPSWFCFDGILDEVSIHAGAFSKDRVRELFARTQPDAAPDLPERRMPFGPP